MRHIIAAVVLVLIAVDPGVGNAQGMRWTHPEGRYSLDVSGWRQVTLAPGARELALFAPATPQAASRLCFIHERVVPTMTGHSQANLNAFAASYAPYAGANDTVTNLRRLTIDGVVVASFVRSNSERRTVAAIRVFALSPAGAAEEISCRGVEPLTEADDAEFERVLNSIRFHSTDAAK